MEWETIRVKHFQELMRALTRADEKGYMPDAMQEAWDNFQFETPEADDESE